MFSPRILSRLKIQGEINMYWQGLYILVTLEDFNRLAMVGTV